MLNWAVTEWDTFQDFIITSKFVNAPISAALLGAIPGAAFGAWFGARAATRMGEKAARKRERLEELRNINRAISASAGICNKILAARKQHVIGLKTRYDELKRSFAEAVLRNGRFEAGMDMQTLSLAECGAFRKPRQTCWMARDITMQRRRTERPAH
jgi:hypothetical protein